MDEEEAESAGILVPLLFGMHSITTGLAAKEEPEETGDRMLLAEYDANVDAGIAITKKSDSISKSIDTYKKNWLCIPDTSFGFGS